MKSDSQPLCFQFLGGILLLSAAGVAKGAPLAEASPEAYADSYGYAQYGQAHSNPPLYHQQSPHVTPVALVAGPGLATNSILFCFLFVTPRRGNTFFFHSSQQLPLLRLGPVKGFLS